MSTLHTTIFSLLAIGSSLSAQVLPQAQIVFEVEASYPSEDFGRNGFVRLGDVDGDGVIDIAVTGVRSSVGTVQHVGAYSGVDGHQLWDVIMPGIGWAHWISGGGDIDGDGIWDVLVWAQWDGPGAVHVLSGATGNTIRVHYGGGLGLGMQRPGPIFGDADGDGYDDYLISDSTNPNLINWAEAEAVSGRTGAVLYTVPYAVAITPYSWATALGDVNGDDLADCAIANGSCTIQCNPAVSVLSGPTGQVIYTIPGPLSMSGPRCGGEDIDGDGVGDFVAIGAANGMAELRAYSGATGALIWGRTEPGIGSTIGIAGDWNGDGHAEVLVLVHTPYRWLVLSGLDGTDLQSTPLTIPLLSYGIEPILFDDIDGDGCREVLSRGGRSPQFQPSNDGSVFLTKHANGPLSYRVEVGHGCVASNGYMPRASLRADPRLGTTAALRLRGTVPGSPTVCILGVPLPSGVSFEWTPGCELYVNPAPIQSLPQPGTTDARGMAGIDVPIPSVPALAGLRLAVQWFVVDPGANASGVIGSSAVQLLLGT